MTVANATVGWEYTTAWDPSSMPTTTEADHERDKPDAIPAQTYYRRGRDLVSIPRPLKRLFDKFPLHTYPANELPVGSPRRNKLPTLYIFSDDEDARLGKPSYHPGCLKWQVCVFPFPCATLAIGN